MVRTAIRSATIEPCQLSARPAPSRFARVTCPQTCFDVVALGPAMLLSGVMPADCFTLIFVFNCPEKVHSFNFGLEHTDGYMGFFPPGAPLDARTSTNHGTATLTIPTAVFRGALARHFPEIPDKVLAQGAGVRIEPKDQTRVRALIAGIKEIVWNHSDVLDDALARRHLQNELIEVFLAALRSGCGNLMAPGTLRLPGRLKKLRQARDYVAAHSGQPIHLDDICAAVGLSPRGVENLFHDFLGVGPNAFLRHQRLHAARRALRRATPEPGVVKQVALESGFWHLGHFANEYRTLFGETPSGTLAWPKDH